MEVIARKGKKLNFGSLSVLIVDDQEFYLNLLSAVLRGMGIYTVATAADGSEALDAAKDMRPNVIFSDWVMPEMSGIEFTRRLRRSREPRISQIPVIMVTANSLKAQIETARSAGVDTFVLKPITVKAVADKLREVVETPRDFIRTSSYIGPCRRRNRAIVNYAGPLRRFTDPVEVEEFSKDSDEIAIKTKLREISTQIELLLASVQRGDFSKLELIKIAGSEAQALAVKVGDEALSKVCWSLCAYIDKFGNSKATRADIVLTHLQAIENLIKIPNGLKDMRDKIAAGLHTVVVKALKVA